MRKISIFLAAGALAVLNFSTTAYATDMGARPMPQQPRYTPQYASVPNLTGLYVGGVLNYTHAGNCDAQTASAFGFWLSASCDGDGFGGGLLAQALYQPRGSQWFIGGRVMYELLNADGGSAIVLNGPGGCGICGALAGTNFKAGLDDAWTLSLLGGWKHQSTTLYVHGGWKTADGSAKATALGITAKDSKRHDGWEIGFGVMQELQNNLSLFAEYAYSDYRPKTYNFAVGGGNVPAQFDPGSTHAVRLGLNYKFLTGG